MHGHSYGWLNKWMSVWMCLWKDGSIDWCTHPWWMDEFIDGYMYICVYGWIDTVAVFMLGWMNHKSTFRDLSAASSQGSLALDRYWDWFSLQPVVLFSHYFVMTVNCFEKWRTAAATVQSAILSEQALWVMKLNLPSNRYIHQWIHLWAVQLKLVHVVLLPHSLT